MRELAREDLEALRPARPKGEIVARFRDSHHMLARLFASGLKVSEIARRTGYSFNRVSMFANDPAFKDLVAQYRQMVNEDWKDSVDEFFTLATSNMLKAERQIADKLDAADEEGDALPTRDLISISRDAADRFGYSKHSFQHNTNTDFADLLDRAIERSGKVVELNPPRSTPASPRALALALPGGCSPGGEVGPDHLPPQPIRRRI